MDYKGDIPPANPTDESSKSKAEIIEERKANLPLPDEPPVASDWNSADGRTVNVGSGGDVASTGERAEAAAAESAARVDATENKTATEGLDVGREAEDNLSGIPNDAVAQGSKNKKGLADTTGKDYGYPEKSDPSSGIK